MMGERQSTVPRLAIFLPSLEGGGAERVYINLANQFVAFGVPVDMVLAWARGPYLSELDARIRVIDLGVASKVQTIPALARYLRRDPRREKFLPVAIKTSLHIGRSRLDQNLFLGNFRMDQRFDGRRSR